jgi:DNA polymerase-3 subunit epsilon
MNHQTIVIIDFETTGFKPKEDEIIEIGAIKFHTSDLSKYETFQTFISYEQPLPQKIIEITHITDGMLHENGIDREIAAQKLYSFIPEDAVLSGYNVMFDLGFYDALIKKCIKKEYVIKNDVLDILTIFRDLSKTSHKLSDAVSFYDVQTPNTHRALDDVIATFEVFKAMMKQEEQVIKTYTNIIGYPPFRSYYGLKLPHVKYLPQRSGLKDLSIVHKL